MARVTLSNISKHFGPVKAVKDFSLTVEDKEFAILVGPSGCGKSTVLRIIAGLEKPTTGDVHFGQKRVTDLPPKDRDVAMVFQEYALYPQKTVYKNMGFALKVRGASREEMERKVKEAADILGIRDLLLRKPRQLSGGQRQRVAVGRAIVRDPAVFLFDEPLSNLDANLRVQMRAELSKLHSRLRATMIYVTHDQVEAMTMGTKIVVMKDGLIQQIGSPMEIYNSPVNLFVAGFIGSPVMNFIPCQILLEGDHLVIDAESFQLPIPEWKANYFRSAAGSAVILGIRPNDIYHARHAPQRLQGEGIPAVIDVIEPLGPEIQLTVNIGRHNLKACIGVDDTLRVNQKIEVVFDLDRMHLFGEEPPHLRYDMEPEHSARNQLPSGSVQSRR